MTVGDLITKLEKFDKNMRVFVSYNDIEYGLTLGSFPSVSVVNLVTSDGAYDYEPWYTYGVMVPHKREKCVVLKG